MSSYPGAAMGGRTLDPMEFDGRELGHRFGDLRSPYPFMTVGGMMVNRNDISSASYRRVVRSPQLCVLGAAAGGVRTRSHALCSRHPASGLEVALAARLLKSALDLGVTLRSSTIASSLVEHCGRISGVALGRDARDEVVNAKRGVAATGGFAADKAWRRRMVPRDDVHVSLAPEGNTGDGLVMAQAVGAVLDANCANAVFGTPVSTMSTADGSVRAFPHLVSDRQRPGVIAVDSRGLRFTDESALDDAFVQAMHRAAAIPADPRVRPHLHRRYGLGSAAERARPGGVVTGEGVRACRLPA